MANTASKIPAPARRTGFWLTVATLIVVIALYYFGEFREASKYLLLIGGGLAILGSLFFTSLRIK
jgi:hypothetical protein